MAGDLEPHDPSRLRISDTERNQVAEILRDAAAEGRIDLDELDERLDAVFAAKTYAELEPITRDLPLDNIRPPSRTPAVRRQTLPTTTTYDRTTAIMSESKRPGAWLVPAQHAVFALMGSVRLDLRQASFVAGETTISVTAIMSGVDVIVDEYTQVVVDGVGIMGEFTEASGDDEAPARLGDQSPVVRVTGAAFMSAVNVKRRFSPTSSG